MTQRGERIALTILLLILAGLPLAILGYQYVLRPAASGIRVVDIRAAAPEAGGFLPDSLQVRAGETVTLRFSSVDVTHGIAIGPGLGIDLGHVDPGYVREVTLTFDRPGAYTFYCNAWCSPNHWRMRGVIEVRDLSDSMPTPQRDPVIEALATEGVDIDAALHTTPQPHTDETPPLLESQPSAARGAALIEQLAIPPELRGAMWRRSHTPAQGLALLVALNPSASTADLADAVASLWIGSRSAETLNPAAVLYGKNCAACHGESGGGDGPNASQTVREPVAFADVRYMFERRGDVLYAKIRRGGMGTDMPNFGTLFTPEETWALVDYLWTLALTGQ